MAGQQIQFSAPQYATKSTAHSQLANILGSRPGSDESNCATDHKNTLINVLKALHDRQDSNPATSALSSHCTPSTSSAPEPQAEIIPQVMESQEHPVLENLPSKKIRGDGNRTRMSSSAFIAQLSQNIARHELSSESPSSVSSSSSSRSYSASPVQRTRGSTEPVACRVPVASRSREESIFQYAHSAMLNSIADTQFDAPSAAAKSADKLHAHSIEPGREHPDVVGDNTSSSDDFLSRRVNPVVDTTDMSVEQILEIIRVPLLTPHLPNNDQQKEFLDQHEIGHLNHLVKCLSDSILTVSLPDSLNGKVNLMPMDFLDVYCSSVLRVYYILLKNLDYLSLELSDKVALFGSGLLKALLCLSFIVYKEDTCSWSIPNGASELNPVTVKRTDLCQILPNHLIQQALTITTISMNLKFDWTIILLCVGAFFYTPINVEVRNMKNIEKLRDRYIEILFKYIKWKHGLSNSVIIFPEILKLLDAVLKHCQIIENVKLSLKEDEIVSLERRLMTLTTNEGMGMFTYPNLINSDDDFGTGVTFAKLNRRVMAHLHQSCAVISRQYAAVPTASMYYSNQPGESEAATSRTEEFIKRLNKSNRELEITKVEVEMDEEQHEKASSVEIDPVSDENLSPKMSSDKAFSIRRFLLDLSRKQQNPMSPDSASSSPAQETPEDALQAFPAALPQQLIQHRLYQTNSFVAAHQQHVANFAKSLGCRTPNPKPRCVSPDAAMDLSQPRSVTGPPPLLRPKLPDLRPLNTGQTLPLMPASDSSAVVTAAGLELLRALSVSMSSASDSSLPRQPQQQLTLKQAEQLLDCLSQANLLPKKEPL